jgi:uncharacterized membrane protein (UPF0182 family)
VIRGNLLVIPMNHALIYIEPIYLRAEQSEIPQLARVIIASQEKVAMGESLADAIEKLVGVRGAKETTAVLSKAQTVEPLRPQVDVAELVKKLSSEFEALSKSVKEGKWAEFGQRLENMGNIIRQLKESMEIKE